MIYRREIVSEFLRLDCAVCVCVLEDSTSEKVNLNLE